MLTQEEKEKKNGATAAKPAAAKIAAPRMDGDAKNQPQRSPRSLSKREHTLCPLCSRWQT